MYPQNQETNVASQMKSDLLNSNDIKIKMIKNGSFTLERAKHVLNLITPDRYRHDMIIFNNSAGDLLIKFKIENTNYNELFDLYKMLNEVFYYYFQFEIADRLDNILTIEEKKYLMDKRNTNLFYSIESYADGIIYIRI